MLNSRNGKLHPAGWNMHGQSAALHLAGVPARGEARAAIGDDPAPLAAVTADLIVAIATGDAGRSVGPADADGVRSSRAGWLGHRCGAASGVAIVSPRPDALHRAVEASTLARRVSAPLPIAFSAARPANGIAPAIASGAIRLRTPERPSSPKED